MLGKEDGSDNYLFTKEGSPEETLDWYGFKYYTTAHTDGGCTTLHPHWLSCIERMFGGDKVWENALDWCAGDGGVGLMVLGSGYAKKISFLEPYPKAVANLRKNIERNNLDCEIFPIDNIAELTGKYDLVIGNTPSARIPSLYDMYHMGWLRKNVFYPLKYEDALKDLKSKSPHRVFDFGWKIHKEFFANIEKNLLPGADVLLLENPKDFNPLFWEWGPTNLKLVRWIDQNQIKSFPRPRVVLHFKYE